MRVLNKNLIILNLTLFLISFGLYLTTLSPDVTFEDSGELITAAYTLSIPHPPGYPLFVIISKLFTYIMPFKNIEFRINLASAFFASISLSLLSLLFYRITVNLKFKKPLFYSILATSLLLISTSFWNIAIITEVYALNFFLFTLQLYLMIKAIEKFALNYFNLFFYISGLALGNHHTSIFMLIIFGIMFLFNKWWKKLSFKDYIKFLLLFLLGFSIYIYLPLRAADLPILNWGNPVNLKNFFAVLFRQQYGTLPDKLLSLKEILLQLRTVNPLYELYAKFQDILRFSLLNIGILCLLIYLVYAGIRKVHNKNIMWLFISIFLFYTLLLILITQTPEDKLFTLKVFFIPAWAVFYYFIAVGILHTLKYNNFIFIIILLLGVLNFKFHNNRNYFYTYDYAKNILKNTKYNSIIFTVKDNETFPLWDMRYVKYKRPDIIIINLVILSEQWYIEQIVRNYKNLNITLPFLKGRFPKSHIRKIFLENIVKSNPDKDIYFTSKKFEKFVKVEYNLKSAGILYKLAEKSIDIPPRIIYNLEFQNLEEDFKRFSLLFDKLSLENFNSEIVYLDTQTKLVLQNCANLLYEYNNSFLYAYKKCIYFNNIIGVGINNIYAYTKVGDLFLTLKDRKRFEYFYKKAISLQPFSKFAQKLKMKLTDKTGVLLIEIMRKAETYYSAGNFIEAIKYYKKALDVSPDSPQIYSNIGDCYFNLRNYRTAIKYYEKAIQLNKNYITPYYNLGGCYLMLGDRKEATRVWKAGLKIAPQNNLLKNAIAKWGTK